MNEVRAFVDNELSEYSLCNEGLLMCLIITKTTQWQNMDLEAGNDNELQ